MTFGTDEDSQEPCHRALRESFVLGCFHINNEAAKKSTKARTAFLQFLRLCVKHKADFVGGDANMAANLRQTGQLVADRENSICAIAMRQTQMVAGSLIFTLSCLAIFVNPIFWIGSAALGLGLFHAGASGTCGLATVISWLPWNRPRHCFKCG